MQFPTTHWSSLAQASLNGHSESKLAFDRFCQRYRGPILRFIQHRTRNDAAAEDLTHEFLLHLLEKSTLQRADPGRGKFRSFLLGALVRFLGDQSDRRNSQKRGGQSPHVSFELFTDSAPDGTPVVDPADALGFDREWAFRVLDLALERLRHEHDVAGTGQRPGSFGLLKDFLPGGAAPLSYDEAALQLGISLPALKSEIHRLRRQLRVLVREEIAQTVSAPHELEEEMAYLQQVLMDKGSDWKQDPPQKN